VSNLSPADRTRLVKLLGLLGSNHAGERDAAGLAAQRFIKSRGISWDDALSISRTNRHSSDEAEWRVTCRKLRDKTHALRPWEVGFVSGLPRFNRLSDKQRRILNEIADRVLGGGAN
jgi:hypothetical protein